VRIALDFDGTISDLIGGYVLYAREHFGVDVPYERAIGQRPPYLGEERHGEMVRAVLGSEFALSLDPLPGARQAIERLRGEHELFVVTARNDDEVPWAHRWMERHGIEVEDFVHTSRGPKLEACTALGATLILDDSPPVIDELHGTDVTPVLIDAPYNREAALPDGARRVEGWPEFEALCAEMAAAG
jgi:uncharacterized HAD superfamily protein